MIPYKLEFSDLVAFRDVYDSFLDDEYLFEVVYAIDGAFLEESIRASRIAAKGKKKAA